MLHFNNYRVLYKHSNWYTSEEKMKEMPKIEVFGPTNTPHKNISRVFCLLHTNQVETGL